MSDPLVLLPGLACDYAVWEGVAAALPGVETQVIDYGAASSLEAMAAIALAEAPPRFALAGHSMGGRVAMEVIRQAPARVTRVALLNTGFRPLADGEAGEREVAGRMRLVELAQRAGTAAMAREWVQGMVHPDRQQETSLIESIIAMMARKTPAEFAAQIEALIHRPDATPVLSGLRIPCLLMSGSHDSWSPLSQHEEMAEYARRARVVAIADAGHMAPMEKPEAVATELAAWLAA
ncbi:MAG: alpha/beta hydrolase [Spongiibacteraceae bacterium]|jgi:pimeloyl-ACP methyl ester carboxylesterase|nr:alpha/beta hydrolase [Spongiibacteraceae bacterium]